MYECVCTHTQCCAVCHMVSSFAVLGRNSPTSGSGATCRPKDWTASIFSGSMIVGLWTRRRCPAPCCGAAAAALCPECVRGGDISRAETQSGALHQPLVRPQLLRQDSDYRRQEEVRLKLHVTRYIFTRLPPTQNHYLCAIQLAKGHGADVRLHRTAMVFVCFH